VRDRCERAARHRASVRRSDVAARIPSGFNGLSQQVEEHKCLLVGQVEVHRSGYVVDTPTMAEDRRVYARFRSSSLAPDL
jgi:hypothetical protein